jgi:hypothetical protein
VLKAHSYLCAAHASPMGPGVGQSQRQGKAKKRICGCSFSQPSQAQAYLLTQLLVNLKLHRQAVAVPPKPAAHMVPGSSCKAGDCVLQGTSTTQGVLVGVGGVESITGKAGEKAGKESKSRLPDSALQHKASWMGYTITSRELPQ